MALIKCPECGHSVSENAPTCPECGVEISGKITRCPQCGQFYFSYQPSCPNCKHHTLTAQPQPAAPVAAPAAAPATEPQPIPAPQTPKKKGYGTLIAAFVIALIAVGVGYYFYHNAQSGDEQEAYEYALASTDPDVLQSYLDAYADANQAHRDSIQSHLQRLQLADSEWTNAVVSGSKSALEAYMAKYPNSAHAMDANRKIDSIDWNAAVADDTENGYQGYLDNHPNGAYIDDANDAMQALKAKTLQPEEKELVTTLFKHFFQSINTKNEDGIASTVASFLNSFLGKTDATKDDVITFMHRIYKNDITGMLWRLGDDIKIDKKEVGADKYEYSVQFSATQDIDRTDATKEKHAKYLIKATVDSDGKISAFNMTKILE